MKKKTILELDKYIESCTDYSKLTAGKMAYECNVSQATISRYVKEIGYDDFYHFKFSLSEKGLIEKNLQKTSDLILKKINYADYCLSELKEFNFDQLQILKQKKLILVYSESRFNLITKIFIEKMSLVDNKICLVRSVSEYKYMRNKFKENCMMICIGEIPRNLYSKRLNYLVIKYKEEINHIEENVCVINILNKRQGKKENKINDNLIPVMLVLDIIVDEYIRMTNEYNDIKKYLL